MQYNVMTLVLCGAVTLVTPTECKDCNMLLPVLLTKCGPCQWCLLRVSTPNWSVYADRYKSFASAAFTERTCVWTKCEDTLFAQERHWCALRPFHFLCSHFKCSYGRDDMAIDTSCSLKVGPHNQYFQNSGFPHQLPSSNYWKYPTPTPVHNRNAQMLLGSLGFAWRSLVGAKQLCTG